jgi:tetratricopeptide (TPR) repeat protein
MANLSLKRTAAKKTKAKKSSAKMPKAARTSSKTTINAFSMGALSKGSNNRWQDIKTRGLDFTIITCLFLIFFLCPLFFTGLVAQGIGFEKMMLFYFLVLLGTVAWIVKAVIKGGVSIKKSLLDLPILGILILLVISTMTSVNPKISLVGDYGNSAKGLMAVITFILFYYLLINNINLKRIKILFWSLVASSSLIIVYSALQLLNIFILPANFTHSINFNPVGALHTLSKFLIVILPVMVLSTAQIKEINAKIKPTWNLSLRILLGVVTLGAFTILAFLNNITFWTVAIIGMAVVLLFLLSKTVKISNNDLAIPITAFFLLVIFLVLGNFNIININVPAETKLPYYVSWNIAKEGVKSDPFFGSGPSTFYYSFSKYRGADYNMTPFWNIRFLNSSGFIFELLSDIGILGTLAVIIVLAISVIYCFRVIITVKEREVQPILLSFFASFLMVIIVSLLSPLDNSLILVFVLIGGFAVATAVNVSPNKQEDIKLSFRISPRHNLVVAAIFLIISAGIMAMFTWGIKMYIADLYANKSLTALSVGDKISNANKAVQFAPYRDVYYVNLSNHFINLINNEARESNNQDKILINLNQAIENAKTAVKIAPEKAANNEFLALLYEKASAYMDGGINLWAKSIEDSYGKIIELEPDNPMPYLKIAALNMARGDLESNQNEKNKLYNEAIKNYDIAIAKKSNLAAAYYGKGIVYEKLQDLDNAIEQLKLAVDNSGNNVGYAFELGRLYFNRGTAKAEAVKSPSKSAAEGENEDLDVEIEAGQPSKTIVKRNEDINIANQIFLNIIQVEKNHPNTLYSLALLYRAVGETDNAKAAVKQLLNILDDDKQKERIKNQFKDLY